MNKKSICIYVHFNVSGKIPFYVIHYINSISKHFDQILFCMNDIETNNLNDIFKSNNIVIDKMKNLGYDFGLFYRKIKTLNLSEYYRIGFINDSNILFGEIDKIFNWGYNSGLDMWGITESYECPPGVDPKNSYHVQSHFLIFENEAISNLLDFFNSINFEKIFKIQKDMKLRELRLKIIRDCEIGISQYLLKKNLKIGSYINTLTFIKNNSNRDPKYTNIHIHLWDSLIKNNYPFIKKKIVINGFDPIHESILPDFSNWKKLLTEKCDKLLLEKILKDI